MISKNHIIFLVLFIPVPLKGQRKKEYSNMLWAGYYNTTHFDKNWSLVSDVQLRTKDWPQKWSQLLVRSGLSYAFNDHVSVAGGVAFFKNAHYGEKRLLLKNEWRPWQEFSYQHKLHKKNFMHRLRTEQRFLQQVVNDTKTKKYEYVFRLRYRFDWQFPVKKNDLRLLIGNEILVNPGFINKSRFFDQNRTYAGLNYKLFSNTSLQCQYLKIFQWRSNTSVLEDQNVFRLNILQQFKFK